MKQRMLLPTAASRLDPFPTEIAPDEPAPVPPWNGWDRIGFGLATVAAFGVGIAAPAVVLALTGSVAISTPPKADWAVAALDQVRFGAESQPAAAQPAGGQAAPLALERVPSFANHWLLELSGLASNESAARPVPRLSTKLAVAVRPGATEPLPIHVENAPARDEKMHLIVRGVPEFASLSAAEPRADGTWHVPLSSAGNVKLTAYALPATDHELVIELRSDGGEVLARATTALTGQPAAKAEAVPVQGESPVRASPAPRTAVVDADDHGPPASRPVRRPTPGTVTKVAKGQDMPAAAPQKRRSPQTGQMRAGLADVTAPSSAAKSLQAAPQTNPLGKTPRIVIVNGPLPAPPSGPPPASAPPVPQSGTPAWMQPWARSAFTVD